MTEALWAGAFGDDYSARCVDAGAKRGPFWKSFLERHPVGSAFEVGCNVGGNLVNLEAPGRIVYGIDVNVGALTLAAKTLKAPCLYQMSATAIKFWPNAFELVFTAGVLIHIPTEDLNKVLDSMVRISSKYVMLIEYDAPQEEVVPYRGQAAALWKRPYPELMASRFPELRLLEVRGLGPEDGFDDCTMALWEKP